MKRHHLDQSIAIAFSELPWFLLVGVLLFYCNHCVKVDKLIAEKDERIAKLEGELKLLEKKYHDALQKLEKIKSDTQPSKNQQATITKEELERLQEIERKYNQLSEELQPYGSLSQLIDRLIRAEEKNKICEKNHEQDQKQTKQPIEVTQSEALVRKELLGLKGSLIKVAFVLDTSLSMSYDRRWSSTCNTVKDWLTYLNVEECILIYFNDEITVIKDPNNGYFKMTGDERANNLKNLLDKLSKVHPEGLTYTREALEKAFEYKPDTIILFTDGAPKESIFSKYNKKETRKIHDDCKKRNIPINIVASGDYFEKELCQFLKDLAKGTGGGFIGK